MTRLQMIFTQDHRSAFKSGTSSKFRTIVIASSTVASTELPPPYSCLLQSGLKAVHSLRSVCNIQADVISRFCLTTKANADRS